MGRVKDIKSTAAYLDKETDQFVRTARGQILSVQNLSDTAYEGLTQLCHAADDLGKKFRPSDFNPKMKLTELGPPSAGARKEVEQMVKLLRDDMRQKLVKQAKALQDTIE